MEGSGQYWVLWYLETEDYLTHKSTVYNGNISVHVWQREGFRAGRARHHQSTSISPFRLLKHSIELIVTQKGLKEPYDWDEYAESFFPKAQELARIAADAQTQGENDKASEYFLYVSHEKGASKLFLNFY